MSYFKADLLLWTEPVSARECFALRRPPDPGSDQLSVVGVSAQVLRVAIEASVAGFEIYRIGETALESQIEFWDFRQFGKIEAALPRRLSSIVERRDFIFCKTFSVQAQPITQLRDAIGKIHRRAAIAQRFTIHMHAQTALKESLQGEWITRPAIDRRLRHAEFEVWRELKADLATTDEGLRIQVPTILTLRAGDEDAGIVDELLTRKLPQDDLQPHVAEIPKKTGQLERTNATDPEHL